MSIELHVCSLVVQVKPERMPEVRQAIMVIKDTELSVNNEIKLVVVIEGKGRKQVMECVDEINAIPGVISTSVVYQQSEVLEEDEI
ncbi:chaperone NapD [Parashewanella tropica]|uniref:chaperone NapD n=1 Tax=Parashewanella tropica TaxID=2547970 RepID=UPI00105A3B7C|nr:chaperone NapD [Parashewanella tropica]